MGIFVLLVDIKLDVGGFLASRYAFCVLFACRFSAHCYVINGRLCVMMCPGQRCRLCVLSLVLIDDVCSAHQTHHTLELLTERNV